MLSEIRGFSSQFGYALEHYSELLTPFKVDSIVVAGMGGSSLPADLVNDYLSYEGSPCLVRISRDYSLPSDINENTLVICSSYSGNTEETIASFHEALKKNAQIIVLANGGQLRDLAIQHKKLHVEIPHAIQPRCAVGYFFSSLLFILESCGWLRDVAIKLNRIQKFIQQSDFDCETKGKELAKGMKDLLPILYGPTSLNALLRIFKIKLNENAKIQAFYNVFPELNHNEMVGFTHLITKPVILQIRSQYMHSRISLRMDVMKKLLNSSMPFFDVYLKGGDYLEELFYAHLIADYTSYYLALEYGVDPAPVDMVETFKKMLN